MKIQSAGFEHYKTYVQKVKTGEASGKAGAAGSSAARSDKVTLSGGAAARSELSRLASTLSAEANNAVSPEKLEELRGAVQSGSYYVSSDELADALLDIDA